jgi:hypothetical protein
MTIQADSVGRLGRAVILELQYEHPRAVRSVTSRQAVRVRQYVEIFRVYPGQHAEQVHTARLRCNPWCGHERRDA